MTKTCRYDRDEIEEAFYNADARWDGESGMGELFHLLCEELEKLPDLGDGDE